MEGTPSLEAGYVGSYIAGPGLKGRRALEEPFLQGGPSPQDLPFPPFRSVTTPRTQGMGLLKSEA